jgi:hypothetical protein
MRSHPKIRAGIGIALFLALLPWLVAPAAEPASKLETITGKVMPLKAALEKIGVKLDKDAGGVALVTDDGHVYPLVKDDGGRMFFKDERLLNRPMRLTGRLVADGRLFQVLHVRSVSKSGELFEVFYWCDICSIKRFEKQDCDCCGALMELRELPEKK